MPVSSVVKQEKCLSNDKQSSTLDLENDWEDIVKKATPLPPQKRTKNWKHSRKYRRKSKKNIQTNEDDDKY